MTQRTQSVVARLNQLIQKAEQVLATHQPNPLIGHGFPTLNTEAFAGWRSQCLAFLIKLFGEGHTYTQRFESEVRPAAHRSCVFAGLGILRAVVEDVEADELAAHEGPDNPVSTLERMCTRFHMIVRQLRSRHDGRPTLDVRDEYDVQDLLHALLKLSFDDVRPEEWTPSYAGKSSRMDFLLKQEQIVIETKKTRLGFSHKRLADELIVDIERYGAHPECKTLVCFVYDPEGLIPNPTGLASDLSRAEPMAVQVLIRPSN